MSLNVLLERINLQLKGNRDLTKNLGNIFPKESFTFGLEAGPTLFWLIGSHTAITEISGDYTRNSEGTYKPNKDFKTYEEKLSKIRFCSGLRCTDVINRKVEQFPSNGGQAPTFDKRKSADPTQVAYMNRQETLHSCHIVDDSLIAALFEASSRLMKKNRPDELTKNNLPCFLGSASINQDLENYKKRPERSKVLEKIRGANKKEVLEIAWRDATAFALKLFRQHKNDSRALERNLQDAAMIICQYAAEKAGTPIERTD